MRDTKLEYGKYLNFLVDGEQLNKFFIKIERGHSINANLSAIFLRKYNGNGLFDIPPFKNTVNSFLTEAYGLNPDVTDRNFYISSRLIWQDMLKRKANLTSEENIIFVYLSFLVKEYNQFFNGLSLLNKHILNTKNTEEEKRNEYLKIIDYYKKGYEGELKKIPHTIN